MSNLGDLNWNRYPVEQTVTLEYIIFSATTFSHVSIDVPMLLFILLRVFRKKNEKEHS